MQENEFMGEVINKLGISREDIARIKTTGDLSWVIVVKGGSPSGFERVCNLHGGDRFSALCDWHYDSAYAQGMFNRRTYIGDRGKREFRAKVTALFSRK